MKFPPCSSYWANIRQKRPNLTASLSRSIINSASVPFRLACVRLATRYLMSSSVAMLNKDIDFRNSSFKGPSGSYSSDGVKSSLSKIAIVSISLKPTAFKVAHRAGYFCKWRAIFSAALGINLPHQ